MIETTTQKNELKLKSIFRSISPSVSVLILWGIPLFITAGNINYWNAWLFILTISISWIAINLYLAKYDPSLFEKRQKKTEKKNITADDFVLMHFLISIRNYFIWS